MFTRPTEADRDRRRTDLVARAGLIRAYGWADYRGVWSTGEVVAVAALLGDHAVLDELGETLQSVWARWAFELWGMTDGQADVDAGCRQTHRWFIDTAGVL